MIINITLILLGLVCINFLLLAFSCNKLNKKQQINKEPKVINRSNLIATESVSSELAATGS